MPVNLSLILNISTFRGTAYHKNDNAPVFNLKMTKPLDRDTVSFKSTPKTLTSRTNDIPRNVANSIHKIGLERQSKADKFINELFGNLLVTKSSPGKIIESISGRVKTPTSIIEKASTNEWRSKDEILNNMTDLNGEKIVLRDGSRDCVAVILNVLTDAITDKKVDLIEIENKRPSAAKKLKGIKTLQYDYATPEQLERLRDLTDSIHTSEKVNYIPAEYTAANYTALHFLFKLPGENWTFETQLIGHDVALYKDLDDIIYKILNNKNVDKKYKKLVDILAPLNEPGNKKLKEQFNKYRSNVFLFQRSKAPHIRGCESYTEYFLPVSDEITDSNMSRILDINNLYKIYMSCNEKAAQKKTISKKA